MRPFVHPTLSYPAGYGPNVQLHGSVCTFAPHFPSAHSLYSGFRLKRCQAMQSPEVRFTELPVQALGASHAIMHADMFG
jgi:hypothetical protein